MNKIFFVIYLIAYSFVAYSNENNVSLSLPSGPGSIEGLGAGFEPSLNTGGAGYSIAIAAPAGRAGHGPSVSLSYSSGQGYGLSGLGWDLGLPKIERSIEQGQPKYNSEDSFQISGQRLVALTDGTYAPQIQGNLGFPIKKSSSASGPLITRFKQSGNGWVVTDSDGYRYEFGLHDKANVPILGQHSRNGIDPSTFDGTFCWYLTRVIDPLNNQVEFVYRRVSDSPGKLYPYYIAYNNINESTDAKVIGADNRIVFEYVSRTDQRLNYQNGFQQKTTRRLNNVKTYHGSRIISHYDLEYKTQTDGSSLSLLEKVTRYNYNKSEQLPSMYFTYSELPDASELTTARINNLPTGINLVGGDVSWMDMNADGLTDWFYWKSGQYFWSENLGQTQDGTEQSVADIKFGPAQLIKGLPVAPISDSRIHIVDLDGDGARDMLYRTSNSIWRFYRNQRDGTFAEPIAYPAPASIIVGEANVRFSDLNFDQRIDLVASSNGRWYQCLNGLASNRDTPNLGMQNPYDQDLPPLGNFPGVEDIDHDGDRTIDIPGWSCTGGRTNSLPGGVNLTNSQVRFQDMNGDRLDDMVTVRYLNDRIEVGYYPHIGQLEFANFERIAPSEKTSGPSSIGVNPNELQLRDINGDGLTDLVHTRSGQVIYWLQKGNLTWAEPVTLNAPSFNPNATARLSADINGNGTTDLIWLPLNGNESPTWLDISAPKNLSLNKVLQNGGFRVSKSNLLVQIDNGMGMRTQLSYESSGEHSGRAKQAGISWKSESPLIQHMVIARRVQLGVDATGEGVADDIIQHYRFRDPYYDPYRKQFRGFAFARVETQANLEGFDENSDAGDAEITRPVSRHFFHTGAPDGIDNDGDGIADERDLDGSTEEQPLVGMSYSQEQSSAHISLADDEEAVGTDLFSRTSQNWTVRRQYNLTTPTATRSGLEISYSVLSQSQTQTYEMSADSRSRIIDYQYNDLGKTSLQIDHGLLDVVGDESQKITKYATHADGLFQKASFTEVLDHEGMRLSASRNWFDYQSASGGNGSQTLSKGLMTASDAWLNNDAGSDKWIPQGATRFNGDGNPITITDGDGRTRKLEWDTRWRTFPVAEHIFTNGPGGVLTVGAGYDTGLGVLTRHQDSNGALSKLTYDGFGRVRTIERPYDNDPSTTYHYEQVDPFRGISLLNGKLQVQQVYKSSRITTELQRRDGRIERQWSLIDGGNRVLANVQDAEDQGWLYSDVKGYDHQGRVDSEYRPYFISKLGQSPHDFTFPNAAQDQGHTDIQLDPVGRPIIETLPADNLGIRSTNIYAYFPYKFTRTDADDYVHQQETDYADRIIKVSQPKGEQKPNAPSFDSQTFEYDVLGRIRLLRDAYGNEKTLKYDGLSRKTFQHDLDQGDSFYEYDNASNLKQKTDNLNRVLSYQYDGVSRLLSISDMTAEDKGADTYPNTTGVSGGKLLYQYYYDVPHTDAPASVQQQARQMAGKITAIEYFTQKDSFNSSNASNSFLAGEFYHYDLRGNQDQKIVKQQNRLYGFHYKYDKQDRLITQTWPDGDTLRYRHNLRGLVEKVDGFIDQATYAADGQLTDLTYSNGSQQTREYDLRGRLTDLISAQNSGEHNKSLLDLNYRYNQRGFIKNISNALSGKHSQQFDYDAKGQLTFAKSHYGQLDYGYDAIGNITSKQHSLLSAGSATAQAGSHHLQALTYENKNNRTHKTINDNPLTAGPHTPVASDAGHQWGYNGIGQRTKTKQPNGDLHNYRWDILGRLTQWRLTNSTGDISAKEEYSYNPDGRRLTKESCQLNSNQTSTASISSFDCNTVFYIDPSFELRDEYYKNGIQKHVKLGNLRIARIDTPQLQAQAQLAKQSIQLNPGWNPVYLNIHPQGSDVQQQLKSADAALNIYNSVERIAYFDVKSQRYKEYQRPSPLKPNTGNLEQLESSSALWVKVDALQFIDWQPDNDPDQNQESQSQTDQNQTTFINKTLKPGWNWTTLPLQTEIEVADYLAYHPSVKRIWAYDAGKGSWSFWDSSLWLRAQKDKQTAEKRPSETQLTKLKPDTLYWVYSHSEQPLNDLSSSAGLSISGQQVFLHNDHLGSVTLTLSDSGALQQHSYYQPYGDAANIQPHKTQPYGFSGKEKDRSGLMYFEARYYDPLSTRFISPDPLFSEDVGRCVGSVIECNLYQYTGNNPVNFVDVFGLETWPVEGVDLVATSNNNSVGGFFGNSRNSGNKFHGGVDVGGSEGDRVSAYKQGKVIRAGYQSQSNPNVGFGLRVVIEHQEFSNSVESSPSGRKTYSVYGHLDSLAEGVQNGVTVSEGQKIGEVGRSGNAYNVLNTHLHFEIRVDAYPGSSSNNLNPEGQFNSREKAFQNIPSTHINEARNNMYNDTQIPNALPHIPNWVPE